MRPYPKTLSRRLWLVRLAGLAYFLTMGRLISFAAGNLWLELAAVVSLGVGLCMCLHLHEWQKFRFFARMRADENPACPKCDSELTVSSDVLQCPQCQVDYTPERLSADWQKIVLSNEVTFTRSYPRILARRLRQLQIAGVSGVVAIGWIAKRAGAGTWIEWSLFLLFYGSLFSFLYFYEWDKARYVERVRADDCRICPTCGYKLYGLPDEGRCPECGMAYAVSALRELWRKALL